MARRQTRLWLRFPSLGPALLALLAGCPGTVNLAPDGRVADRDADQQPASDQRAAERDAPRTSPDARTVDLRQVVDTAVIGPPFANTKRSRVTYYAIPHPDDEFESWSLIENDPLSYPILITLTRGEATGYCATGGYSGYQPTLGERPPGDAAGYLSRTCKQNRIGSTLAFYAAMTAIDPYIGPMPQTKTQLKAPPLPAGTPGYGCAVSSDQLEIWSGQNMALVFLDLGDGNLTSCEVQWAISQTRRLLGSAALPALPEKHLVAAGFRNESYPNCYVYDHPDHVAVHQAVWDTNFGIAGGQYGRTCTTDPDHSLIKNVSQYQVLDMQGDQRVGAFQRIYGWLSAKPWPSGAESVSLMSQAQAFWRRF